MNKQTLCERNDIPYLSNVLLKNLCISGLWVAEVDKFVKQFIANDEVVSNTLLLQLFEIFLHHLKIAICKSYISLNKKLVH
jgi:hypothetical protein